MAETVATAHQQQSLALSIDTLSLLNDSKLPRSMEVTVPLLIGKLHEAASTRLILANAEHIVRDIQEVIPGQRLGLSLGLHICRPNASDFPKDVIPTSADLPYPMHKFWKEELLGLVSDPRLWPRIPSKTANALANPVQPDNARAFVVETTKLLAQSNMPLIVRISSIYVERPDLKDMLIKTISDLNISMPDQEIVLAVEPDRGSSANTVEMYQNQLLALPDELKKFGVVASAQVSADVAHLKEIGAANPFEQIVAWAGTKLAPGIIEWNPFQQTPYATHIQIMGSADCSPEHLKTVLDVYRKLGKVPELIIETDPRNFKEDRKNVGNFVRAIR